MPTGFRTAAGTGCIRPAARVWVRQPVGLARTPPAPAKCKNAGQARAKPQPALLVARPDQSPRPAPPRPCARPAAAAPHGPPPGRRCRPASRRRPARWGAVRSPWPPSSSATARYWRQPDHSGPQKPNDAGDRLARVVQTDPFQGAGLARRPFRAPPRPVQAGRCHLAGLPSCEAAPHQACRPIRRSWP